MSVGNDAFILGPDKPRVPAGGHGVYKTQQEQMKTEGG